MNSNDIGKVFEKVADGRLLEEAEAIQLYAHAPLHELINAAHQKRMQLHPDRSVSWMIDRNVNITNVCITACRFCNFSCAKNSSRAFVTTRDEYRQKIGELFNLGGDQLLLQGGLHPDLGLAFYTSMFSWMKSEFPTLKLHALSPAEIDFIARSESLSHEAVLRELTMAGLDSLPGAGAEILSDRVRAIVSPAKISVSAWLGVMRAAHQLGMVTSATMMFGHVETLEERIRHLFLLRNVQDEKPADSPGFLSFIPWPFYAENTTLLREGLVKHFPTPSEYIRLIAISRLVLHNIPHLQASWLTVGNTTAAVCLWAGADDLGSIMIEENVVSSAGASFRLDAETMKQLISESGFEPRRRNQDFTTHKP